MFNPFKKRASEYLRDDEAFLVTVSPAPLFTYLAPKAASDSLYDRLVLLIGTPGSGKTTIAKLFRFPTLQTLLRLTNSADYRALADGMTEARAVDRRKAKVTGCRLLLEGRHRGLWELPYPEEVRNRLLISLIQARAVNEWLSAFESVRIGLDDVAIVRRSSSDVIAEAAGGLDGQGLRQRAPAVERAVYRIANALVPPVIEAIPEELRSPYEPFDVIDGFAVPAGTYHQAILKPLVVLDDAHELHHKQFDALMGWLRRRELGPARWVATRFDPLAPSEVMAPRPADGAGVDSARELTVIRLQGGDGDRAGERREFRKLARDLTGRYLRQIDIFQRRSLTELSDLLETRLPEFPAGRLQELRAENTRVQRALHLRRERVDELEYLVDSYAKGVASGERLNEAVKLRMLRILMHRYAVRAPQRSLFAETDPEPSRPLRADAEVADGALIQLMHDYDTPYYFGFEDLCDASWGNAEQFVKLGAKIVDAIETRLIRDRQPVLTPSDQHRLMREVGREIVENWNFPESQSVRRVTDWMGAVCEAKTMEPNAPLGSGANGVGVPQAEFDRIEKEYPAFSTTLKYGIAYNAFAVRQNRMVKGREWAIVELGGPLVLKHGLTMSRGGFVERTLRDLVAASEGKAG
jgi:hypothetical protein